MEPLDTFRRELPEWTLAYTRLEDELLGFCDLDRQTIWVDVNQPERSMRATVMHEIVHAIRRDEHSLDPVAERDVEIETARRLIPPQSLRAAFAASTHPEDLADILLVDLDVLRTRLRNLDPDETTLLRREVARSIPRDAAIDSGHCALGRWWLHHEQPAPMPCHGRCPTRRHEAASARRALHAVPDLDPAVAEPAV